MAPTFQFAHAMPFSPETAPELLREIPTLPGIFALFGPPSPDGAQPQPYLTRAADLRRRIARLLAPAELSATGEPVQSKRLNLSRRVARIEYTVTGSEFESTLVLYCAARDLFGPDEARRRLRLHTPFFLRFTAENAFPRVYATNRLSRRALDTTYGPFPSRAAAERYADAVLDLFHLRRCHEELAPAPDHPGCIYGEMKRCLAPCNQAHTPQGAAAYSAEAAAVRRFFDTHGNSMVDSIGLEREEASAAMNFERAAELHAQWQKVRAVQALADELVQPVPKLRALVVQRAVKPAAEPAAQTAEPAPPIPHDEAQRAAVFLLHSGCLFGPEMLSTLGVRAVREQTAVGSSLFAQPLMLQAIPLGEDVPGSATPDNIPAPATPVAPALSPETRAQNVIAALEAQSAAHASTPDLATLSDHLSLLRRWYYRPEKQRAGEIFLPDINSSTAGRVAWPIRRILNAAARAALGDPARISDTQRDQAQRDPADAAQKPVRTKILHEGRPDVERVVAVAGKAYRTRKKDLAIKTDRVEGGTGSPVGDK